MSEFKFTWFVTRGGDAEKSLVPIRSRSGVVSECVAAGFLHHPPPQLELIITRASRLNCSSHAALISRLTQPSSTPSRPPWRPEVANLMLSNLRELLRILPCRPTEVSNFRGYVIESARAMLGKPAPNKNAELNSEVLFLLRAQQHLHDLNIKYFPQSGMSEREVIEATAKRVGASSRASLLRLSSLASLHARPYSQSLSHVVMASLGLAVLFSQASTCPRQRHCPSRPSPRHPPHDGNARRRRGRRQWEWACRRPG